MTHTEQAFHWIVSLLNEQQIPFQLSGGFAARLYGAERPLNDIDIELHDADVERIYPLVEPYVLYGPERYRDEAFDLLLMTLSYEGQEIDISGADDDLIYNKDTQQWEARGVSLEDATEQRVYGISVPVISCEHLLAYKKKIQRPVDLFDIQYLQKNVSA